MSEPVGCSPLMAGHEREVVGPELGAQRKKKTKKNRKKEKQKEDNGK